MTAILGVALPLVAAMAGCGATAPGTPSSAARSGGAPVRPAASASGGAGPDAALLKFAECMRQHGMTWFPDPHAGDPAPDFDLPPGVTDQDFEAAQQDCRQSAQAIAKGPVSNAADLADLRRMAKCMRTNGVPGFPDPAADGSLMLDAGELGVDIGSPTFKAAEKACARYRPDETTPVGGSTR